MSKITAASCIIVAVCILQTAYAGLLDNLPSLGSRRNSVLDSVNNAGNGLLDKLPLDSVLDNVQHQVSSTVKNLESQVKAKIYASQEQLQNSEACTQLRSEGEESLSQLVLNFNSCLSKETQLAGNEYKKLANVLSTVEASVSSTLGNILNDLPNNSNLIETVTYIVDSLQKLSAQISPLIKEAGSAVLGLPNVFISLRTCYTTAFLQSVGPVASKLIVDGQQCASNVYKALIS